MCACACGTRIHCKPIKRGLSFFFQDAQLFSHGIIGEGCFGIRKGPVFCRPSQKRRGIYTKEMWTHICGHLQLMSKPARAAG